jgi:prepilin-type N-terminal cleavage/methylation domain-containing protein
MTPLPRSSSLPHPLPPGEGYPTSPRLALGEGYPTSPRLPLGEGYPISHPLPLGEGRGEGAPARHSRVPPAPRGFTLVELLVVVGIIAMLAALVTPAVIRARSAARSAAIDTEIDLLHMAIMTYRNEYGSFPPCDSPITSGSAMARHLQRLFPRCDVPTHLTAVGATAITPQNALASWLGGYTLDPMSPLSPPASRRRLFDFDRTRLTGATYAPVNLTNSPYVYMDNTVYATGSFPIGTNTYTAEASGGVFFNADTFQILCAGLDQIWGTADDLSNFWRGTRQQHAASSQ